MLLPMNSQRQSLWGDVCAVDYIEAMKPAVEERVAHRQSTRAHMTRPCRECNFVVAMTELGQIIIRGKPKWISGVILAQMGSLSF